MKRLLLCLMLASAVSAALVADEVYYDDEGREHVRRGIVGGTLHGVDNFGHNVGHALFGSHRHRRDAGPSQRFCQEHPNAPECN
jgi:hypothetical protein